MKITLLLKAAVVSCNGDTDSQCEELQTKIATCADQTLNTVTGLAGIFSTSPASMGISLESLTDPVLQDMCANQKTFEEFSRCVYKEMNACISFEARGTFPSVDSTVASMTYLCKNAKEIDLTCTAASSRKADQCIAAASNGPPTDITNRDSYISYICGAETKRVSCLKDAVSDCPGRTAEIMTEYMQYQTPAACDATMVRFSWAVVVISLRCTWLKNFNGENR